MFPDVWCAQLMDDCMARYAPTLSQISELQTQLRTSQADHDSMKSGYSALRRENNTLKEQIKETKKRYELFHGCTYVVSDLIILTLLCLVLPSLLFAHSESELVVRLTQKEKDIHTLEVRMLCCWLMLFFCVRSYPHIVCVSFQSLLKDLREQTSKLAMRTRTSYLDPVFPHLSMFLSI